MKHLRQILTEEGLLRTAKLDLNQFEQKMQRLFDWGFVESEGPNTMRFDFRWNGQRQSMWVHSNGEVEGGVPQPKTLMPVLQKMGLHGIVPAPPPRIRGWKIPKSHWGKGARDTAHEHGEFRWVPDWLKPSHWRGNLFFYPKEEYGAAEQRFVAKTLRDADAFVKSFSWSPENQANAGKEALALAKKVKRYLSKIPRDKTYGHLNIDTSMSSTVWVNASGMREEEKNLAGYIKALEKITGMKFSNPRSSSPRFGEGAADGQLSYNVSGEPEGWDVGFTVYWYYGSHSVEGPKEIRGFWIRFNYAKAS